MSNAMQLIFIFLKNNCKEFYHQERYPCLNKIAVFDFKNAAIRYKTSMMFKIAKIRDDYLSNARVSKKAPKYIEKNKYAIVMLKSLSIFKKKVTI